MQTATATLKFEHLVFDTQEYADITAELYCYVDTDNNGNRYIRDYIITRIGINNDWYNSDTYHKMDIEFEELEYIIDFKVLHKGELNSIIKEV